MEISNINDLIKSQEADCAELKRIRDNIKKDSSTRKTQKYIEDRRVTIDSIYHRAAQNHRLLQEQEILSTHKYMTLNYFDTQIRKTYDDAMDHLRICEDKLKIADIQIQTCSTDDKQDKGVSSPKLFIQKYRLNQLEKKVSTALTAISENKPGWHLQSLLTNIEKLFQEIDENNIRLLMDESTVTDEYISQDWFGRAQEMVDDIIEKLQEKINENSKQQNRISSTKLPRITIPNFTGSYESWNSFYDLFKKIIDDDCTISTTEKMQYLKTHIRGDAEKLIKHLTINEANYKAALTLLINRYTDERAITQRFIDRILDLPKIKFPNAKMLRDMHDCINESLEALKNQGIDISTWSPFLSRIVSRKWDNDTNMKYEDHLEEPNKLQDFSKMMKFLEKRFKSLETSKSSTTFNTPTPPSLKNQDNNSNDWQDKKGTCWYCHKDHNINHCLSFKLLNVNDRIKKVREKQMCYICLMHDTKKECVSLKYNKCEICNKAHSTLLHRNVNEYLSSKSQGQSQSNENKYGKPSSSKTYAPKIQTKENQVQKFSSNAYTQINEIRKTVLLATALVQTTTIDGSPQLLRVLCDQGSEASLCTEEVAQLLGYPRRKIKAEIKGIADENPKMSNHMIDVTLKPRFPSAYQLQTSLIVLPRLTGALPKQNLRPFDQIKLENKIIADPTYYKRGPIDIILGAEHYSKLIIQGFEKLENGIIAQNTEIGWILSGFCNNESCTGMKILSLMTSAEEKTLTQFWELEEITDEKPLKNDDQICENFYDKTTKRNPDGTYTVRLPIKDSSLEYGNTRQKAMARLMQLEKKLDKNSNLRRQYNDFMTEYLTMNHMRKVNKINYHEGKYYIPHQPVIRENAVTTKLRCVFDASSKGSTNMSLNDNMYKGPRLQQDMSTILLRWRKHKFAFMADIEKMYRCIKIGEPDLPYQRILWRWSAQQAIQEFELTRVTYGTTGAPYLAIKTLQKLAMDEEQNYPIASKVTLQDFYVDDVLSGENDLEKTKMLQNQLSQMLKAGGFNLRKWSCNSAELLESIPEGNIDDEMIKLPLDETRKSLGVVWLPNQDTFKFKIEVTDSEYPTKRFIISEIAKIFDPLGWLQPVIITLKLLIQEIWISKLGWNEKIPEKIYKKWVTIQQQLKCLENITIPRWIHYTEGSLELYGFSDASEKAYGAVVYSRTKVNDTYHVRLLQAKTKVAPLKNKSTLPRLELCATVLLTKLIKKVKIALQCDITKIYCFTDSMITIGWIKGEPDRWKTFVANRVSEVQRILPEASWHHVSSAENPADVISRGIEPSNLPNYSLWWNGPEWLQTDKIRESMLIPDPSVEVKSCCSTVMEIKNKNEVLERFSSFEKMVRILSYCWRFVRGNRKTGLLTCEELDKTRTQIILLVQRASFKQDYEHIKKGQIVKKTSKLSSLDPFIDENGIIRVGGRLQHSQLPYDQKHPILLPYDHHVTLILIHDAHVKTLHSGNRLTLSYLRQRYWIIGGKRKVKSYINKCTKCIRYKAETASQKMGALPKPRVTQSYPFSHTGCDFAGPIQVRAMKGRGHKSYKGYIAVFICLATKAIHLELVGDLSTESFIAALRRFMARRGHVSHMYSDNATNFVGAANFLYKEILEITQSPTFQNTITNMGTQWHFIPPAAPHFGGIWEAGVKSMKHHLKRVIGDSTLTYEELSTFLHQIEACLNTRPLCIQTENINDNIVLTPSHFLIGREAVGFPDPISNMNTNLINCWKHIQKMKRDFWLCWTKEYLHQLQQRYKWKANGENLKVGTVVLIKDGNISPSKWPLARVKEIHPGSDGVTRVVTLQRAQGSDQKRAIHSLIPLPVNESLETSEDKTPVQSNVAIVEENNTRKHKKNSYRKPYYWFLMIMFIFIQMLAQTGASYTIKNLEPGLYIEKIGNTTLDRGTFRIEKHYERSILNQKVEATKEILDQFKSLCYHAKTLYRDTHCIQYHSHLQEEAEKVEKINEYLNELNQTRKKRGLLGQMMTYLFGVNDEVYRDIDSLDKNQQKLIDAANHQTKFMLKTIATVNQSETRIQEKLNSYQTKLNQVISYINNNNGWYQSVDRNTIQLYMLHSYQMAYNYIAEIISYYAGIMDIYLSKATIYRVITPKNIADIIKAANSKLPSNLNIIQNQLLDTRLSENETHITVLAYFPITEKAKYTLLHVTPIPMKYRDGIYQSLDIQQSVIGIDYNNERYFELTHEEFKDCLHRFNDYICFPVAVKNMQLNRNCIVEFITKNETKTDCSTRTYNVTNEIIWKQVQMTNTWIYVTKQKETISIVCDGQREEVSIHDVGIIQISENCIIKTITTTLVAKRVISENVIASYSKKSEFKLSSNITVLNKYNNIKKEQVIDSSKDIFNNLANEEETLQTTLDNTVWSSITIQTYVASLSTLLIFSFIVLVIYCFGPQIRQKIQNLVTTRRVDASPNSSPSEDQQSNTQSAPQSQTQTSPIYARPFPRKPSPGPALELYQLDSVPERRQNVYVP